MTNGTQRKNPYVRGIAASLSLLFASAAAFGAPVRDYPDPPPGAVYETRSLGLQSFSVTMEVKVGSVRAGETLTLVRDGGEGDGKNGWGVMLEGRHEGVFPVFLFTWNQHSIPVSGDMALPCGRWCRLTCRAAFGEDVEIYLDGACVARRSRGQAVINFSKGPFRFAPPAAGAAVRNFRVTDEPVAPADEILLGMRAKSLAEAIDAAGSDARRLETLRREFCRSGDVANEDRVLARLLKDGTAGNRRIDRLLRRAEIAMLHGDRATAHGFYDEIVRDASAGETERMIAKAMCLRTGDGTDGGEPPYSARNPSTSAVRETGATQVEFHVATNGSDGNDGSAAHPFASVAKGCAAACACGRPAAVLVHAGTYRQRKGVVLAQGTAPLVVRAAGDGRVLLYGGHAVRGLKRCEDPDVLARLPDETARAQALVADLAADGYASRARQGSYAAGSLRPREEKGARLLWRGTEAWPSARYPNRGWILTEKFDRERPAFVCPDLRMKRWGRATDAIAYGWWLWSFFDAALPVKAFETDHGVVVLGERVQYTFADGRPWKVVNLLEEIDEPGEWYFDAATGRLYVMPPAGKADGLELAETEDDFFTLKARSNVTFEAIDLDCAWRCGFVARDCTNVTVRGCSVTRLGGSAVIALECPGLAVSRCSFRHLGHAGVEVVAGDRATLTSGRATVEDCEIGNVGLLCGTYAPCVELRGVGGRLSHNHFHDGPSSAIRMSGNDHLIEYNLVERMVKRSNDQGAVDIYGDPSYRGIVFRYNVFRDNGRDDGFAGAEMRGDTPKDAGIRFDDAISGLVVYGNRFVRTSRGGFGAMQTHGGHRNLFDGNVVVGGTFGLGNGGWDYGHWCSYLKSKGQSAHMGKALFGEVDLKGPLYLGRYPELARLGVRGEENRNFAFRNAFVGVECDVKDDGRFMVNHLNGSFATVEAYERAVGSGPFAGILPRLPPESEIGIRPNRK